jgi:hypothetical protein
VSLRIVIAINRHLPGVWSRSPPQSARAKFSTCAEGVKGDGPGTALENRLAESATVALPSRSHEGMQVRVTGHELARSRHKCAGKFLILLMSLLKT